MNSAPSNTVYLETSSEIRRRQELEVTRRERDFWQKTAEQLQDHLDRIFDIAASGERVEITQRGKKVALKADLISPQT